MWGEVSFETSEKIHTLRVIGDRGTGKIYAAAQPLLCDHYVDAVPLDSVNLKFITSFCIQLYSYNLSSSFKEVTLDHLEKLLRLIKPTAQGKPPVRYKRESSNYMDLAAPTWIGRQLLSMRLPVDSVTMSINGKEFEAAAEEFFKSAGPLYYICLYCCRDFILKQSTIDAMIEKF
uniref:BTB domain-containing protein n=1 Tax=Steinernema glaseri TaxID=37863 RepID=A0A1I7Z8A8_9BILA